MLAGARNRRLVLGAALCVAVMLAGTASAGTQATFDGKVAHFRQSEIVVKRLSDRQGIFDLNGLRKYCVDGTTETLGFSPVHINIARDGSFERFKTILGPLTGSQSVLWVKGTFSGMNKVSGRLFVSRDPWSSDEPRCSTRMKLSWKARRR